MSAEDNRMLALLERGHIEANEAIVALKASWKQEDADIAELRRHIWAAHEQGAKDRDAMRVKLGGRSLIEADARAAEGAAAARKAAQDAKAAEDTAEAKAAAEARAEKADAKADAAQAKADAKADAKATK